MRITLALGVFVTVVCFVHGFRIPRQSGYSTGQIAIPQAAPQNSAPQHAPVAQTQGYQNFVAPALTGYHQTAVQQAQAAHPSEQQKYSLNLSQEPQQQGQFYPVAAAVPTEAATEAPADELRTADVQSETVAPPQEEPVEAALPKEPLVPTVPVEESLVPEEEPKFDSVMPEDIAQEIRTSEAEPAGDIPLSSVNPDSFSLLVSIPESSPASEEEAPQDPATLVDPLPAVQDFGTAQGEFNMEVPQEEPVVVEQQPVEVVNDIPEVKPEDEAVVTPQQGVIPVAEDQPQSAAPETAIPKEAPQEVRTQPEGKYAVYSGDNVGYFRNPVNVKSLDAHVRANAARIVSEKFNEYMTDLAGFPGTIQAQSKVKQPSLGYGVPLGQPISWKA